jgi:hypothetical protein
MLFPPYFLSGEQMDASKVKAEQLIESFQKLGDSHRALGLFIKNNKDVLSKPLLKTLSLTHKQLATQQQELIDLAFDKIFRKKGK